MVDRASYVTGADVSRYQRRTIPGRNTDSTPSHGAIAMANDNSAINPAAPAIGQARGRSENAGVRVARGRSVATSSGAAPMGMEIDHVASFAALARTAHLGLRADAGSAASRPVARAVGAVRAG
ncbi:hypothetical protein GCM10020258_05230 [Sphingomonas yabuuchiae]